MMKFHLGDDDIKL